MNAGFNIRGEVNVEVLRLRTGGGRRVAEIPALRVGGRPVPFAAFRQVPCEPVVDWPSGLLKGEPLGRVHYFWGACAARGRFGHLHVVWIKDGELRRACVERPPPVRADPAAWNTRYERLAALPHLFIDV